MWNRHWNTVMLCISIIRFLWNLHWILSLSIMTHCIWKFAIVLFGCWCSLKSHHIYVSACLPSYPLKLLKKKTLYRRDCPKYFYKRCQWANFLLILIYHNFSMKCSHVCALHFLFVRIIQVVYNFLLCCGGCELKHYTNLINHNMYLVSYHYCCPIKLQLYKYL